MTARDLILANVRHRRLRSALEIGTFALSSAMFVAAFALVERAAVPVSGFAGPRITVMSYGDWPLPLAIVEQLRRFPGVKDIEYQRLQGCRDEKVSSYYCIVWGVTDGWPTAYPSSVLHIPPAVDAAWRKDRQGVMAVRSVADHFNWKVGSAVSISLFGRKSPITANFVGYVESEVPFAILHFDHVVHDLADPANLSRLSVGCEPSRCAALTSEIDAEFANSPAPTYTLTQEAFFASVNRSSSTVPLLFALLGAVVIGVGAVMTGASLSINLRERSAELATLRALGFTRGRVFRLLLGECLTTATIGGLLGAGIPFAITQVSPVTFFGGVGAVALLKNLSVSPVGFAGGVLIAVTLGALLCVLPARRSMRQSIIEALAA